MRAIRFSLILGSPKTLEVLSALLLATIKPKKQLCGVSDDNCCGTGVSEGIEDVYTEEAHHSYILKV